ncbi:ABC transporter substrate-binding protein [Natrinema versiforme]|uniref:ABC transporter substrate-binding protein n=1 Tax=Natrinema versiforme TaxID=88724 RepID=A0A4P8WN35_9EURY|nr:ABC transporter substrate-binding protein [Natrinema versiforme]QCS45028.1 ABC transporter substrate-binding protein [Natrinema versiforme]
MTDEIDTTVDGPTRRDTLKYGGALATGTALAGCSELVGQSDERGAQSGEGTYSVTMAPMGEVSFDSPPESIFTRLTHHAGMAFALGRGNDVNAMHAPEYYDKLWNQFTPRLPGVTLDWTGLYSSWEPSKEKLYDLESDVHLADPASVNALDSWNAEDVEEIGGTVSPWFGNTYSDRHDEPPANWADRYEYYGLWEMFEKVAGIFQEAERYEALAEIHTSLLDTIEANLPAKEERPTVVMAGMSDIEGMYAYTLDTPGFLTAHVRPLDPIGALGDNISSGDVIDMEVLLEADPDVLFSLGGMHPETDLAGIRSSLRNHSAGSRLSAVQNDRVYPQGARYQGPILNLFQLEMTAKQLYPDVFGEWPTYTEGPYPEIPADEQLFDRQAVADIITGDR